MNMRKIVWAASLTLVLGTAAGVAAQDLVQVGDHHAPVAEHSDQAVLNALVAAGDAAGAFLIAFEEGDELFEADFNALDGGGANVGQGQRFTRTPRADLNGPGEWATHTPARSTGPNGQSCISCHNLPFPDGAGPAMANVTRDPLHTGDTAQMINRNTPHMFGIGALQLVAEEMTAELAEVVEEAIEEACEEQTEMTFDLIAKDVNFGTVTVTPTGPEVDDSCDHILTINAEGIDDDLIVRPYQWKGTDLTMRQFVAGALHNEIGMQPVEMVGAGVDGDGDGVTDEFPVGSVTTLTIYLAAQPRPVTKAELALVGLDTLCDDEAAAIAAGEALFETVGCATCHVPALEVENTVFSEPSQSLAYQPSPMPAGLDPATPITFDITTDHFDNAFELADGTIVRLGDFETTAEGAAIIRAYSDLKRHDMGPGLAEAIDETGHGASVFLTKELWGLADTAPYLHDGRATTITEAIQWHGGEGQASKDAFDALTVEEQGQIITFLSSLRTLLFEEEEAAELPVCDPAPPVDPPVDPPVAEDAITVDFVRYKVSTGKWSIRATNTVAAGQSVEIWYGAADTGTLLGTATVTAGGLIKLSTAENHPVVGAAGDTVTLRSSLGAEVSVEITLTGI